MVTDPVAPVDPLRPSLDGIPPTLRDRGRWSPWQAVWNERRKKWDKVPHRWDKPQWGVSSAKIDAWGTFDQAWTAYLANDPRFAGVGVVVTGQHEWIAYDLDKCRDPDSGAIAEWAQTLVDRLASYTEVSPSGKGLRIFCLGTLERDWTNHEQGIEVYAGNTARFVTVTGLRVGAAVDLQPVDADVHAAIARDFGAKPGASTVVDAAHLFEIPTLLPAESLPDVSQLILGDAVQAFLSTGEAGGDRSARLQSTAVRLATAGFSPTMILSIMAANPHAMQAAVDKRGQDWDRALAYLWRHHVLKATEKAKDSVASPDEFPQLGATKPPPWPNFSRDKAARIEATLVNVHLALERADISGMELGYDEFLDELMFARAPGEWQRFRDIHYTELRQTLEKKGFRPIGREMMRDAVAFVAELQAFDSAITWLDSLQWDGVPRIDSFLTTYFGAADDAYTRAAARYLWTALAGRVLEPGVQADMMPILYGAQGIGKSTGVAAMVPSPDFFCEVSFHEQADDRARKMRGKLVVEIGELHGLHTRDLEEIKAWLTRKHEQWVPKYKEFSSSYPRRSLAIGTTNQEAFLADETGNRRFLPITVTKCYVEQVKKDRNQLWAEAAARFLLTGVDFKEAEKAAPTVHKLHEIREPWEQVISEWLESPDFADSQKIDVQTNSRFFTSLDVAIGALHITPKDFRKSDEMRIAKSLRMGGFSPVRRYVNGVLCRIWEKPAIQLSEHDNHDNL